MKNFNEKERRCEATFLSAGAYWHVYTSVKEVPILFADIDDFKFAMNVIAQTARKYPESEAVLICLFEG